MSPKATVMLICRPESRSPHRSVSSADSCYDVAIASAVVAVVGIASAAVVAIAMFIGVAFVVVLAVVVVQ